ncbi:MAG: ATP-dependent helicase HrpB [Polyangiaceae bacterium]|nr:ATP-dependent helicase HrpB [Polyangiaceae bacterium]
MQALPIDEVLPEIALRLREAGRVVIEAPPGAGKSTRVPLTLLSELPPGSRVWVSEPRRLAARLLANRVSSELGQPLGDPVGYAVRFERRVSQDTRLVYATTGVLLRELFAGKKRDIAAVVLDEVHERSVEIDLLLALLREECRQRPEFKLVVMSATLDAEPIAELLRDDTRGACPRVRSAGRVFPLEILHQPQVDDRPLEKQVVSAVRHHLRQGPDGHVLVFLPGAREIRNCHEALEPLAREAGFVTCDLHGDLDLKQQDQAVSDSATRKVVLSTNVAESSVTVPGTTGVIDSGLARVARHSPWTGLLSLKLEKISQASATQRAGRAGRTAPGLVQRLYTAGDLSTRPSFETPEILRADLASLLLELGCAELSASALGWLSAPPEAALRDAERLLGWLGALDGEHATELGRRMQRLPLPPRLARVLIRAEELEVPASGALAVALLSERDILARSPVRHSRGPRPVDASGDSDVAERMERFELCREDRFSQHSARSLELNLAAVKSVARAETQLVKALAGKGELSDSCPLSEVDARISQALLAGFPDRVAARRLSTTGKGVSRDLTFMSGQVARLSEQSVVHEAQLLLGLEVADRRGAGGPEVTQACVIEEDWLFEAYPELFSDKDELWFNPETARVERIARMYYGSVCIDERKAPAAPGPEATRVLKEWVLSRGLKQLDPKDHLGELAARIELCLKADASLVDCSTAPPPQTRESLLELCLGEAVDLSAFKAQELAVAAQSLLPAELVAALYRDAPAEITLNGGRKTQVHYTGGSGPWVQSFLQDFFGSTETPRIAAGRVPLTLHLLAPNRRAIQVTQDLAGFWQRAYPELRRQLSRRYPRHSWPEDGATATPSAPRPPRPRGKK